MTRGASCGLDRFSLSTHSMRRSPSWEANRFSASQEIPSILRNPKVHYPTHNSPPPIFIQSQINLVHVPLPKHFLKVHLNIILPPTSWSPQCALSLRLPHQHPVHPAGTMKKLNLLCFFYLKVSLIQAFRYESLSKHFTSTGDAGVGSSVSSSLYNLSCFSGFFASWYIHELTDTDVWKKECIFIIASYCGLVI